MNLQSSLDKAAIFLSLLCAVHCFLLPVLVVLFSTFIPFTVDDELFHKWLLLGTLPVSIIALTMGCRQHKRYSVYVFGMVGLAVLGIATVFGHDHLGEVWEKSLTLLGGFIVAAGHVSNYRLCRKSESVCTAPASA